MEVLGRSPLPCSSVPSCSVLRIRRPRSPPLLEYSIASASSNARLPPVLESSIPPLLQLRVNAPMIYGDCRMAACSAPRPRPAASRASENLRTRIQGPPVHPTRVYDPDRPRCLPLARSNDVHRFCLVADRAEQPPRNIVQSSIRHQQLQRASLVVVPHLVGCHPVPAAHLSGSEEEVDGGECQSDRCDRPAAAPAPPSDRPRRK